MAAGVFTVFTAVGLVPRFADRTQSANCIILYENMIILGTVAGTIYSLFGTLLHGIERLQQEPGFRLVVLVVYGLFTGIYVGTLAISIAEILDAIPIMAHRTKLKRGVGIVVISFAAGKLLGSLFYFLVGVYDC